MPQIPSALPTSPAKPAAQTGIRPLTRTSKDTSSAFAALIEQTMRNGASAAASAGSNAPDPAARAAAKAGAKPSRRDEDEASGASVGSEASSSTDQASQGQLFPAAATLLQGLPFAIPASATPAASKTGANAADKAANASAASIARQTNRIDALGATVVRVQTQFAPSTQFSSQIAAASADSPIQSEEAAAIASMEARSASKASSPQRSGEDVAVKIALRGSLAAQAAESSASAAISAQQPPAPPSGSAPQQQDNEADPPAASDTDPGKASGTSHRFVSIGSRESAASREDDNTGDAAAQTSVKAPLASAANPGAAPAAGDLSFATPAQQISAEIQSSLPAATVAQTSNDVQQSAPDAPLKTITIALNPASLGNVAVELTLKSGKLGVKLQVDDPATAQMLRQDDGALEKLLQSAGYTVQSLHVSLQSPATAGAAAQTAQSGQNFSDQFNPSSGGQQQQTSQSFDGQPDRRQDQRPRYERVQDLDGGGSLYV